MKKALIFYLWGRKNSGDMAICLGAIYLLKKRGYKIKFISRFSENQEGYIESKKYIDKYFDDVEIIPNILEWNRESSIVKKLYFYTIGIFRYMFFKNSLWNKEIKNADLICLNGGNLLRCKTLTDYIRLKALFFPLWKSKKYNKKIICLPQSTAKSNFLGKIVLKKNLKVFTKIFIRESKSYEIINLLTKGNTIQTADLAFFIEDIKNNIELERTLSIKINDKKNIALVLRNTTIGDLGELPNEQQKEISRNIINLVNKIKHKYNIYFIIQTKKDMEFTKNIANQVNKLNYSIEEYDVFILREIYKQMHFVVAMRLHAAILSMSVSTPVIGYFIREWGYKNEGIMKDVGLPYSITGEELIDMVKDIDDNREEYTRKIETFIENEKNKILDIIE